MLPNMYKSITEPWFLLVLNTNGKGLAFDTQKDQL